MAARVIEIVFESGRREAGQKSVDNILLDGKPMSTEGGSIAGDPFGEWEKRADGRWGLKIQFVEAEWED